MEVFKLIIDGSFRFVFRNSMPISDKERHAEQLLRALQPAAYHRVLKGVAVIYDTPTKENIEAMCEKLHALESDTYKWDSHISFT